MFCPECGLEYRDGFTRCSDCDVDLTAQPPKHGEPDVKLVKVFETVNPVLITVVESLFDGAEIDFLTRSGDLQELISGARLATGINSAMGPVEFWVREDEELAARELLEELERGSEAELLEDEPVPGGRDPSDG
jgi:hypothetical protein